MIQDTTARITFPTNNQHWFLDQTLPNLETLHKGVPNQTITIGCSHEFFICNNVEYVNI